jgi:hypothetical protein
MDDVLDELREVINSNLQICWDSMSQGSAIKLKNASSTWFTIQDSTTTLLTEEGHRGRRDNHATTMTAALMTLLSPPITQMTQRQRSSETIALSLS